MASIKTDVAKTETIVDAFGRVSFSWPKQDAVYPDRFGGGKSTKLLLFTVPLNGTGLVADGSIYMRLKVTDTGHELVPSASVPKALSGPKEATDRFLAHVENAAIEWPDYDKAFIAASDRLLGVKTAPTASGPAVRPNMVPRLVKHNAPAAIVTAN